MSLIARLGVVLGLNIEEFVKGTDEATKKTREYEYQLRRQIRQTEQAMTDAFNKMSIASAAFAAVLVNTFRQADEISDIAKGFDTSIEGLLATQAALQGAGGNAEDVATMFQKLAIAQDNAKEGSDEVRAAFERLGIVGSKVDSLKLGDLFKEVAIALASVEDAGTRAALAQDLLGKAVKGVNWKDFVDKYKEFKDPSLVKAIEQNAQAWETIELAMKNIKLLMMEIAAPFARLVNYAANYADSMVKAQMAQRNMSFLPGGLGVGTNRDPFATNRNEQEANRMLEGYDVDTPIVGFGDQGGYGKKSKQQLADDKTRATKAEAERKKQLAEAQKLADKQKEIAALIEKINLSTKQNVDLMTKQYSIDTQLLDLEMNRHLMSDNSYEIKKKTLEQTKELEKLTADYFKFETDARAELNKATGLDAKFAKEVYENKMQQASTEYALKFTNLKSLQEKEIEVIKNASAIRRQYEKEDRDIAYLNQMVAIDLQYKAVYENLKLEDQAFLLSTDSFNLLKMKLSVIGQIAQIEEEYSVKELAIKTEFARKSEEERRSSLGQYQEQLKNLENLKERELEYLDAIQNKREENYINEIARQQSWTAGWLDASKQYFEAMEKASTRGANAFNSMMGNMNSALSNFVNTGKISFEDLTASIIRDLIRIELQAQASRMFGMIWNSISGFFGSTTGSTPAYTANVAFGKKASGGGINAPTIVGENGAELFVPNTPGTIIPNGSWQQAAAGMGNSGFTNNGTYIANMSAIDTQSATQFLASNKNTIWAAYQSANRSVPISR
jgi:lambda family phage tail tape measure protein